MHSVVVVVVGAIFMPDGQPLSPQSPSLVVVQRCFGIELILLYVVRQYNYYSLPSLVQIVTPQVNSLKDFQGFSCKKLGPTLTDLWMSRCKLPNISFHICIPQVFNRYVQCYPNKVICRDWLSFLMLYLLSLYKYFVTAFLRFLTRGTAIFSDAVSLTFRNQDKQLLLYNVSSYSLLAVVLGLIPDRFALQDAFRGCDLCTFIRLQPMLVWCFSMLLLRLLPSLKFIPRYSCCLFGSVSLSVYGLISS